ncbi:3'-5' exoribonuclease 1-like [Artemia franciscana]|uniref:Exonuclease domain-containing protein n=1 Tax=Artemia franciscana TaxID=6661 RepID=A0AA88H709_ARTSF|nr:hypothetical protein QYM36_016115 [Artemia franciscana]
MSGFKLVGRKNRIEFSQVPNELLEFNEDEIILDSGKSVEHSNGFDVGGNSLNEKVKRNTVKHSSKKPNYLKKLPKIARDHPVYTRLKGIDKWIGTLSKEEVSDKLKQFQLECNGKRDVLSNRLKHFYKHQLLIMAALQEKNKYSVPLTYDYFVVIDFEATCEAGKQEEYRHEIIEFPAVLIKGTTGEVVDEFRQFCRPSLEPKLSDFCLELTGISQETIDASPSFIEVLDMFKRWLEKHQLGTKYSFSLVTDGPWDMGRFLLIQCSLCGITFPEFALTWCNIRKIFSNYYDTRRYPLSVMLELLGMEFEGRAHSGLDDARNIARILSRLLLDGANLRVNERIYLGPLPSQNQKPIPKDLKIYDLSSVVVPISSEEFKRYYKCQMKIEDDSLSARVEGIKIL